MHSRLQNGQIAW